MSNRISVSIITPTYNVADMLSEAIATVTAQTFADWELVVIDDGSSDRTRAFLSGLKEPRIRWIASEHIGAPAVLRNRAISESNGEWVAFLDSDDQWEPRKLEIQMAALRSQPQFSWSYTSTTPIDAKGSMIEQSSAWNWKPQSGWILQPLVRREAVVPASSVMVRRAAFDSVGGFEPTAGPVEDYELWFRLAARFACLCVPQRLCRSRSRNDSYQSDRIAAHQAWQRAIRRVWIANPDVTTRRLCEREIQRHRLTEAAKRLRRGERRVPAQLLAQSIVPGLKHRIGLRSFMSSARELVRARRATRPGT